MTEESALLANHQPAVKVAGRRLSTSSRAKPHSQQESASASSESSDNPDIDYPRPSAPSEERPHNDSHNHYRDEDPVKKEKRHQTRIVHTKSESTMPTREPQNLAKGFGAGGRIAQPAGKVFNG